MRENIPEIWHILRVSLFVDPRIVWWRKEKLTTHFNFVESSSYKWIWTFLRIPLKVYIAAKENIYLHDRQWYTFYNFYVPATLLKWLKFKYLIRGPLGPVWGNMFLACLEWQHTSREVPWDIGKLVKNDWPREMGSHIINPPLSRKSRVLTGY